MGNDNGDSDIIKFQNETDFLPASIFIAGNDREILASTLI
jgi:hypothetical protein